MKHTIRKILKKKEVYAVEGMLWISVAGQRCFGPGRMQLLEHIHKTGSINKAAKAMEMSYKKAWTMINELNQQFMAPMVITQSGGDGGGGTVLTDAAKELMKYHEGMRRRFALFMQKENSHLNS